MYVRIHFLVIRNDVQQISIVMFKNYVLQHHDSNYLDMNIRGDISL